MGTVSCLFPGTTAPAVTLEPSDCTLVNVPGQQFWHTHVCEVCGSSWTHIAPTPMTQGVNRKIHTCTKCGTLSYKFIRLEESPDIPLGWVAAGALAGLVLASMLDRR